MTFLPDGLYDLVLNNALRKQAESLQASGQAEIDELSPAERRRRLVQEISRLLPDLLDSLPETGDSKSSEKFELALINQLLANVREQVSPNQGPDWSAPVVALRSVHRNGLPPLFPPTGLTSPWLFTAGRADPSLFAELRAELNSADRVDILVSFITWSGLRKLWDVLEAITAVDASGNPRTRIRIITTTYTGATEARAVEALAHLPGVDLKISLDGRRSRLHAKAWLFRRGTGFGSAFVGSANLSAAALLGGIEWTVKFTEAGQTDLFAAAEAHFETLWNDPEFQHFNADDVTQCQRLREALGEARLPTGTHNVIALPTWFDLRPKAFQEIMLDRLAAERRHGRTRNLLVAATGTGKTVVAAFDYRRLVQEAGSPPTLLFVAHRVEILQQALAAFRQILRRPDFGELLADGYQPISYSHLFATIPSVNTKRLLEQVGTDHWHMVIIDECHHLPAESFKRFATAVRPRYLLGLTATPERSDGAPITQFFDPRPDGSPAVELRLWDALDQQLLAPFEYYATPDECDFSEVSWGYPQKEAQQISAIVTGNHMRAKRVIDAVNRFVADLGNMRAIAFCVDIAHAEFMAECFNSTGFAAMAVTSQTPHSERGRAPIRLAAGDLKVICTCDLYNEGVDIPEANTLLFLRPTQSPVVFQQQLGRGLRLSDGKESCLVLDFVGRLKIGFRFDRLYQSITGLSRRQFMVEMEKGFTNLPPGCHIQFDKVARERVLDSLRDVANQSWRRLIAELSSYAAGRRPDAIRLATFVREQCIELGDIYQNRGGWTALRRAAGVEHRSVGPDELYVGERFDALCHVNDPWRLQVMAKVASEGAKTWAALDGRQRRVVQMLAYQVFANRNDLMDGLGFLERIDRSPLMREEIGELCEYIDQCSDLDPVPCPDVPEEWPLVVHGAYSRNEILVATGWMNESRRPSMRAGVLSLPDWKIELLFVTLDKKEGFHERVAYHDYAISPELFHWQSQNSAGPDTKAGRRYLESHNNGWRFQLFVRESRDHPYIALGPVTLEGVPTGSKPMSIVWRLQVPIPMVMFRRFTVLRM
jgi:superfamily II DNA or RNA helicase/HKD family nuclease